MSAGRAPGEAHHQGRDRACLRGASSWAITTFTGMVKSSNNPPRNRPAAESAPVREDEQRQERHGADHGNEDDEPSAEAVGQFAAGESADARRRSGRATSMALAAASE